MSESPLSDCVGNVNASIVSSWTSLLASGWVPDTRITDYAVLLNSMVTVYNPSLFTSTQNRDIQRWMRDAYQRIYSDAFIRPIHPKTNWQAYRIWTLANISVNVKNAQAIILLRNELFKYVSETIVSSGATVDFIERDSLRYHCYVLIGIIQAILVLHPSNIVVDSRTGVSTTLWSRDSITRWRSLLQPAFQFLDSFIRGQKRHYEFVNSEIASDRSRTDFGKPFQPSDAIALIRIRNVFMSI